MKITKSPTAAGVVTAAAFTASAAHIVSVVAETNHMIFALAYPIGIDGLIFTGIRAMQTGRRWVGAVALLIGAAYSLAFNGHAEHAFTMDPGMIAASMPICFFAAVLIETTAKEEKIEPETVEVVREVEKVVEVEKIVTVLPELLPIVPLAPKAKVVPVRASSGRIHLVRDEPKTDGPAAAGRVAKWDVEKAVRLLADGRTDADVLAMVDGLTAKPWQRTKRAVKIMTEDASVTDATIAETVGQSAAHIARIRAALKEAA